MPANQRDRGWLEPALPPAAPRPPLASLLDKRVRVGGRHRKEGPAADGSQAQPLASLLDKRVSVGGRHRKEGPAADDKVAGLPVAVRMIRKARFDLRGMGGDDHNGQLFEGK
jgi:hypothetical protein